MKKFQSIEHFKQAYKSEHVPEMDEQKIHDAISEQFQSSKKISSVNKQLIFLTTAIFLILTGSVSVAAKLSGWTFVNSNNEELMEVSGYSDQKSFTYDDVIEELTETIEPGEFQYFVAVDEYEQHGVTAITPIYKPSEYTDFQDLKEATGDEMILPTIFPETYQFVQATVTYGGAWEGNIAELAENMYLEAKEQGLQYITRQVHHNSLVSEISIKYKKTSNSDEINVIISTAPSSYTPTLSIPQEDLERSEKREHDGIEYLYDPQYANVDFVREHNGSNWMYHIVNGGGLENEVYIIELTENLIQQ
ncbi:hypothetical protein [Cytobacillus sp. IB215316]|uniref:hypothetical protein n=1 Tax=Cytobacillus sp. IB215316 TaxID=3097354 RepID=UPI002A1503A8|nr:hypothetical protein [Cytobacillus sp. IB215316]MDX8360410.1 hypothetical protein [Cytobacillus sp. IB215316]